MNMKIIKIGLRITSITSVLVFALFLSYNTGNNNGYNTGRDDYIKELTIEAARAASESRAVAGCEHALKGFMNESDHYRGKLNNCEKQLEGEIECLRILNTLFED